jgi:hypothetical protein
MEKSWDSEVRVFVCRALEQRRQQRHIRRQCGEVALISRRSLRRGFLQSTARAGAAGLSAPLFPAADKKTTTNERLAVGVIGVAGQGEYDWTYITARWRG